jgi:hypothetical protein
LTILTKQSMLVQNSGMYVITTKGQSFLASHERLRKIDA